MNVGMASSYRPRSGLQLVAGCKVARLRASSELMRRLYFLAGLHRLTFLANAANPNTTVEAGELEAAARTHGVDVVTSQIRRADDIPPAIEVLKGHAEAIYVQTDPLMNTNRARIYAARNR
jgi:ABC-type uncharacterized transport system substrate-binding protein